MALVKAPFPWFGGKSRVAALVWQRFGAVKNYVEPFFGSGAVLLARPQFQGVETINDLDGFVANFWRAVKANPEAVAEYCDWPVNETDLHARHYWLVTQGRERLATVLGDPEGYDAKVAGWWCWGLCAWIGSGWCSGDGPWAWTGTEWTHLGNAGQGISRQIPHLSGNKGVLSHDRSTMSEFAALAERLRQVRVCHGDWSRVTGDSVTWRHGLTAVFLDPPYSAERSAVYREESFDVAHDVRAWAVEAGARADMRLCLAGYAGEHDELVAAHGWSAVQWKAAGGYGSQGDGQGRQNAAKETLWFSPHCLPPEQATLL